MKILWTSNILFPEARAILLHLKEDSLRSSGGWIIGLAEELVSVDGVKLYVACTSTMVQELTRIEGKRITYFIIPGGDRSGEPLKTDDGNLDIYFKNIINGIQPDIIDIHGTEYAHSAACIRVSDPKRTVVTIQGLLCEYGIHYYDGLENKEIKACSKLFGRTVIDEAGDFLRRANIEREIIQRTEHLIGRTLWDKSHSLEINPDAVYHHCDEVLRQEFYTGTWTYDRCTPHSVFISQGGYPIKGLHHLIDALPQVLLKFPDTKVYVGGWDITNGKYSHLSNYGKIIRRKIERLHLEGIIKFTGQLASSEMKEHFLSANVFVMPSTIENSCNSLAEAQMLGVPCVAACVGGTADMIPSKECGILYPSYDTAMLAGAICEVFAQKNFDNSVMRENAHRRHDRKANATNLLDIYNSLILKG